MNQAGAWVTVCERDARAGGFLRYGIPDFKLAKEAIDRRIDLMKQDGIRWPHWPRVFKTTSSHEEGCARVWNVETLEFLPAKDEPSCLGA